MTFMCKYAKKNNLETLDVTANNLKIVCFKHELVRKCSFVPGG